MPREIRRTELTSLSSIRYVPQDYARNQPDTLDRSALYGFMGTLILLLIGSLLGGGRLTALFDFSSILVVVGGTVGAALIQFSFAEIRQTVLAVRQVLTTRSANLHSYVERLLRAAQILRIQGQRALDGEAALMPDAFTRKALELVADGQSPEEIKKILETDHVQAREFAGRSMRVAEAMGNYAPAMGLIGTVLGLIQMLGGLDDPARVGPSMALALLTTLYGALLSNLVCLPLAGKLRIRAESDEHLRKLVLEAAQSMARLENSVVLEQRLHSFVEAA